MNRRGFLAGLLAITATAVAKPVLILAEKVPAIKKLMGLDELIAWATRTAKAEIAELGFDQAVKDEPTSERKAASDALGNFLIADMKANPEKYRSAEPL